MDHKPKHIIEQAREKAQKAILKTCGSEIQRICDAFGYDTGLWVHSVRFDMMNVTALGDDGPKHALECIPSINHENA